MGATFFNAVAVGGIREDVISSLNMSKLDAFVSPEIDNFFVIALEEARFAAPPLLKNVSEWMSRISETAILSCFVFDDDDIILNFARRGKETQSFLKVSEAFGQSELSEMKHVIDAEELAASFGVPQHAARMAKLLNPVSSAESEYLLESQRYKDLLSCLGLPSWILEFGASYLDQHEADLPFQFGEIDVFRNAES